MGSLWCVGCSLSISNWLTTSFPPGPIRPGGMRRGRPKLLTIARTLQGCYFARVPAIVLTTLNAKYIHAAFGLRYLLANLGPLRDSASIVEFDINQRPTDVAEILLARNPQIIGLGIYIWNVAEAKEVVAAIKRVRPDVTIILGGPEVS